MKASFRVDLGFPTLLEFQGPDMIRFLNGQLTQDVKRVIGSGVSLPSCVTDAKGKLQFRVYLTEAAEGRLWVSAEAGLAELLMVRLTKYLIADDVEVLDISGQFRLFHLIGTVFPAEHDALARLASRFGGEGTDLWIPNGRSVDFPSEFDEISDDELESFRISNGAPAWGKEIFEGMLPPEAGLDQTDISYQKGCYIGQEVISRIKSSGKVNRSLVRLLLGPGVRASEGDALMNGDTVVGNLTSISVSSTVALAYLKRGADRENLQVRTVEGELHPVDIR